MASTVTNLPEGHVKNVYTTNYTIPKATYKKIHAKVDQSLPFRISLFNVGISAYGPSSPAPIGIAVIGFNNYIL
jgi:hypothetical protein